MIKGSSKVKIEIPNKYLHQKLKVDRPVKGHRKTLTKDYLRERQSLL